MVKQRMSTADVAGETACLRQKLLGMRVANIYDVNPKVCNRLAICMIVCARKRLFQTAHALSACDRPSHVAFSLCRLLDRVVLV